MDKKIVILAGLSAVGKTTVAEGMVKADANFVMSRSVTTRAPRNDGKEYEYIYATREEFLAMCTNGEMVEHTEYNGTLYGTSKAELDRIMSKGKTPLLVLEFNGVKAFKEKFGDRVLAIYLYCDINMVEERLYSRIIGTEQTVDKFLNFVNRKNQNLYDYSDMENRVPYFDAFIENCELCDCISNVINFVNSGVPQSAEVKAKIAASLCEMAKEKIKK